MAYPFCRGAAAFAALMATASCETPGGGSADSGVIAANLGQNLVGEDCRVRNAPLPQTDLGILGAFDVFCGNWEEPSARVFQVAPGGDLQRLASDSWWRQRLDQSIECPAPVATAIAGNTAALALDCTFRQGGWPYQALVTEVAGSGFIVESIPAAYPVAVRAVEVVAGLRVAEATGETSQSQEMERVQARLALAQYNINDLSKTRDLYRLAAWYGSRGDYAAAERLYRDVLTNTAAYLAENRSMAAQINLELALVVSNQERYAEAEALLQTVESLRAYLLPADEFRLAQYRANHFANQRKNRDVLAIGGDAPAASVTAIAGEADGVSGTDALAGDAARLQYVQAAVLVEDGQYDEAGAALAAASDTAAAMRTGAPGLTADIDRRRAQVAEAAGNLAEAETLLLASIAAQQDQAVGSPNEGLAHVALGRVYARQGRTGDALAAFRRGFAILAEKPGGFSPDLAMPYFRMRLAEAADRPGDRPAIFAEMFEVAQSLRGPVVAQTIALAQARLAAGDSAVAQLLRDKQDARRRRDLLLPKLALARDPRTLPEQAAALERQWAEASVAIAELDRQTQSAEPRYRQLLDNPVEPDQVIAALRPGEALVQVVIGREASVGFFVSPAGIEAYPIPLTTRQADRVVVELRRPLEAPFDADGNLRSFPAGKAHELFGQLFGPVASRLDGVDHLITVPSGALLSLPFSLLVTAPPPPGAVDHSRLAWMARDHGLTLAPTVQSFVNLRTRTRPSDASRLFAGFGDFVPMGDETALMRAHNMPEQCREQAVAIANNAELRYTAEQLRQVASALGSGPSDIFTRESFTEAKVRQPDLADRRVVFFATHGFLPAKQNCLQEPALQVSAPPGGEGTSDGLLTSNEVLDLPLDAELVVLSACDTGGPEGQNGGEALTGLARAFFYAGARSLLVTHWEVPEEPTGDLLIRTFSHLPQATTLAGALRQAQLTFIADPIFSHPFAWAGLAVVGDGGRTLPALLGATTSQRPDGAAAVRLAGTGPAGSR